MCVSHDLTIKLPIHGVVVVLDFLSCLILCFIRYPPKESEVGLEMSHVTIASWDCRNSIGSHYTNWTSCYFVRISGNSISYYCIASILQYCTQSNPSFICPLLGILCKEQWHAVAHLDHLLTVGLVAVGREWTFPTHWRHNKRDAQPGLDDFSTPSRTASFFLFVVELKSNGTELLAFVCRPKQKMSWRFQLLLMAFADKYVTWITLSWPTVY